jgi:hypothetical protein
MLRIELYAYRSEKERVLYDKIHNCIKMSHLNLNNHNSVQRCPKGYMLKNSITIGVTF